VQPQEPPLDERWDMLADAISRYRDVLDGRAVDETLPASLVARDWAVPLLSLSDDELRELEIAGVEGTMPARFPAELLVLQATAKRLCDVPALAHATPVTRRLRRLETPRKRAQVDALSQLTMPLVRAATRVVDVGSGHGHLARDVAARIERPVIGLERDAAISAKARQLPHWDRLSFREIDVLRDGLALADGDCVLGLHACGELGDVVATGVAERAQSLVLVGCCLQKQRADVRMPLTSSRAGVSAVALPKALLGLSNFTPREQGVEATREENVAARERRHALHALLTAHAGPLRFGAEMDGLNRRAAHDDLAAMVERAFARRGLPAPSPRSIDDAARTAKSLHDQIRRLTLPRILLGRVLEMFVLVDRGLYLQRSGFDVAIGTAFPKEVSARNLTILARRSGSDGARSRALSSAAIE
jgi:SAM-dependent methyltransferase